MVSVFAKDFKGDWPLTPAWELPLKETLVHVCQWHPAMSQMADDLVIQRRGEYVLADRLTRYPLKSSVVILDCPATLGKICENAIVASTHVLIPIQLEIKSISGVSELLTWRESIIEDFTELQSEIARLRISQSPELESELEKLRAELKLRSGEQHVPLAQIAPNPEQPRQTIHIDSIVSMARSLEKDGQIAPVILIPKGDRYLLWDGQRRYEGGKYLGRETIWAVIAPMPENLHRHALLTFIHHEDLNTLDKAEAIVREIAMVTGVAPRKIPTMLSTVLRRLDRQKRAAQLTALVFQTSAEQIKGLETFNLSPIEFQALSVILDLTLNPASVRANLISVLSMPSDLKVAIREQGLRGPNALALAVLTEKTLRIKERIATRERLKATQTVIVENLTVRKTR